MLPLTATESFQQNVLDGRQPARPGRRRRRATVLGADRFMWGSDYPHDEGTYPFTREHLRQVVPRRRPSDELQRILAGNAAKLYDFDLDALAPHRRGRRPDRRRAAPSRSPSCRRTPTTRCEGVEPALA